MGCVDMEQPLDREARNLSKRKPKYLERFSMCFEPFSRAWSWHPCHGLAFEKIPTLEYAYHNAKGGAITKP